MVKLLKIIFVAYLISALLQRCTYDVVPEPENCDTPPSLQLVSVKDASCGSATGALTVQAVGGEAPYRFRITGIDERTEGSFSELPAGNYQVLVEDARGCAGTLEVQVANQDGVNATLAIENAACGTTDGRVEVLADGGVAPYQYRINDQPFQGSNTFTGLPAGAYEVVTRDANGCESVQSAQLTSGVEFARVETIVKTNCAISNCHDGTISPDFRSAATIQQRASRIQERTSSKTMPPASSGKKLSDQQIQDITCWVEDGATVEPNP